MQENGLVFEHSRRFGHNELPSINGFTEFIQPLRFLFVRWAAAAICGVCVQLCFPRAGWVPAGTLGTHTVDAANMLVQCYSCSVFNAWSTYFSSTGGTRPVVLDQDTLTKE